MKLVIDIKHRKSNEWYGYYTKYAGLVTSKCLLCRVCKCICDSDVRGLMLLPCKDWRMDYI